MMESYFSKNNRIRVFLSGFIFLLVFGCNQQKVQNREPVQSSDSARDSTVASRELRDVSFLPYWVTTAQFAGYFVAKEKGIYEKYGINIKIIPYKPFITSSALISKGEADFTALWLVNAIELKASGADIVNIAQLSSRSSAMLLTKKTSGIDSIQDMNGKRAGIWSGFELQPRALFNKYNIDVTIIPIGSTNNLFLMDGVEIVNASWFDEYHSIMNSGYDPEDLNVFFFADYGLNFLEDGIYCLSSKLKNDPALCADFVNATLDGWRYAFNHRDEAVNIVIKYAKIDKLPINRAHQNWMLDRYRDLYLPEGTINFNNALSQKDYQFVGNALKESNLIDKIPEYGKFYQPVIRSR